MKYAAAFNDDRAHRQQEDQRYVGWQTVCGQQVASTVKPDGPWCHICFPDLAHSMEAIWAACRHWDADVDALAKRTNACSRSAIMSRENAVPVAQRQLPTGRPSPN